MSSHAPPPPPPGWYQDPDDQSRRSYWDGVGWAADAPIDEYQSSIAHTPARQLPGIAATVIVTLFFGLLGLIPAALASGRARNDAGMQTNRYWKAFGYTMAVNVLLGVACVVALVLALRHAATVSDAKEISVGMCSQSVVMDEFYDEVVPCSEPHKAEILAIGDESDWLDSDWRAACRDLVEPYDGHGFNPRPSQLADGRSACVVNNSESIGSIGAGETVTLVDFDVVVVPG